MDFKDGEKKLREALRRFRPSSPARPDPFDLEPTTAFEALALKRLEYLEHCIAKLETRVNWLLVMVAGASLSFILKTVFS